MDSVCFSTKNFKKSCKTPQILLDTPHPAQYTLTILTKKAVDMKVVLVEKSNVSLGQSPVQHNTTQHNTTQHNTTQHNTTQHNTTQHGLPMPN
jgi:hypothetical protein